MDLNDNAARIAASFLSQGIQEWGQSDAARAKAAVGYLLLAGFGDPNTTPAAEWLASTIRRLRRGKFEDEVEQLVAFARERTEAA